MIHSEITLATIDGANDGERLQLVLQLSTNQVDIRQQSWGQGVGWFTQGSITVAPEQIPLMVSALNTAPSKTARPARATTLARDQAPHLRVIAYDKPA